MNSAKWNPINNPKYNAKRQELDRIDNHRRIEQMAQDKAILTDAETQAVVARILSSSFGGSCCDYGLEGVTVRFCWVGFFLR